MSGSQDEAVKEYNPYLELKHQIESKFPNEEVLIEEKYKNDVLKGHRIELRTYIKNKITGKETTLDKRSWKLPQNIPTWITKKDLWHHTKEEIDLLIKLKGHKKNPSKQDIETWKNMLEDNVRKTNNDKKPIQVPKIG